MCLEEQHLGQQMLKGLSLLAPCKVDCLQFSFSLKTRLVLISSSAIANHDVAKPKHAARMLRFRVR